MIQKALFFTRVFIFFRIFFFSFFGFISLLGGCAGSSLRPLEPAQLPADLPKHWKQQFHVQDKSLKIGDGEGLEDSKNSKNSKNSKFSLKPSLRPKSIGPVGLRADLEKAPFRRAALDPMRIFEKLSFDIHYIGFLAGQLTLEILPFQFIGADKVYHVRGSAVSTSLFNIFYRFSDIAESFINYEGIYSQQFRVQLNESRQIRDAIELNDSRKKQTYYWNRLRRSSSNLIETRQYAPIEPYSQDSLSVLYYLRHVPLSLGQVIDIPVVSEGKKTGALCVVVRKQEQDSPMGKVQSIVLKIRKKNRESSEDLPDLSQESEKNTGESELWLIDDAWRIPLKLEIKAKIGTVVIDLKKVEWGNP